MDTFFVPTSTSESNFLPVEDATYWPGIGNLTSNFTSRIESANFYESSVRNDFGPTRDALYVVIPITIIYLLIFITGTIGNVSTCIVIARNKLMHTATNYYLFSLAVSDLLLLISGLPVEVYLVWFKYPYIFGEHFCRLRGLAAECSTNASVLTITAFTAERYIAICHPFLSHTMSKLSRVIKVILVIWVVALSFAFPLAMQFGIVNLHDDYPHQDPEIVMCVLKVTLIEHSFEISTLLFFIVPMIVITVLYVMIGLKLRQSNLMKRDNIRDREESTRSNRIGQTLFLSQVPAVTSNQKDERNCRHHTGRSSRRVLKMLVAVVVAFFLCWAPFHVQRLIAIYGTAEDRVSSSSTWMEFLNLLFTYVSGVLYYVSATINPILYNVMSNKFREAFMETLARSCGGKNFSVPPEQRSYSSLSRSQHRGTAATFGSRNVTGGSGIAQDSTDYFLESGKEENLVRTGSTVIRGNGNISNFEVTDSSRRLLREPGNDDSFSRSSSRKFKGINDRRLTQRDGTDVHVPIDGSNPFIQGQMRSSLETSEGFKNAKRGHDQTNDSTKSNRVNLRANNLSAERLRDYEPTIAIEIEARRRKKWWRFFKRLPNAKAFGFHNGRTGYMSPTDSTVNDIESNRLEYLMSSRYTRDTGEQRPV